MDFIVVKINTPIAVLSFLLISSPIIFTQNSTNTKVEPETSDQATSQPSIADDFGNKGGFYDGQLELGYGFDIIKQDDVDGARVSL